MIVSFEISLTCWCSYGYIEIKMLLMLIL